MGGCVFVREREYGWEFMENNHKSAGEKNSAPYVPKAFFSLNGGAFQPVDILGDMEEIRDETLYIVLLNKK
ncbi:hypothetical protein CRH03_23995 [Clostridium sp. HMb25]|nr:hypothetical protein CRH03_23995 [Clostridium sp. HMb25]